MPITDPRERTKVVVLCSDGFYQRYIVQRLFHAYTVVGVVAWMAPGSKNTLGQRLRRYANPLSLGRYLLARWDKCRSARAARPLVESLFLEDGRPPAFPDGIDVLRVNDVNAPEAVTFVKERQPDIVCVNGTNLLRRSLLDLIEFIPHGIINLHTGLSPYSRGGNCNLYALMDMRPEWVGVTIHHINPGIDSGDLIMTAQVPMEEGDLFDHVDARTFRLGADRMVTAVRRLVGGTAERVRQWEEGRLYLRRTGFVYEPYHWYRVNRILRQGLIGRYLADKNEWDRHVRLVGDAG